MTAGLVVNDGSTTRLGILKSNNDACTRKLNV